MGISSHLRRVYLDQFCDDQGGLSADLNGALPRLLFDDRDDRSDKWYKFAVHKMSFVNIRIFREFEVEGTGL